MTTRQIFYTADLITPDGSDTTSDGDGCEPGMGYTCESGWWSPDWSTWTVHDSQESVRPDEYDASWECVSVAEWAVGQMGIRLEGWAEASHWPPTGRETTYYSSDSYTHPYKGVSIRPAAHLYGFKRHELRRISELLAEAKKVTV